jgi:hypothetical protein
LRGSDGQPKAFHIFHEVAFLIEGDHHDHSTASSILCNLSAVFPFTLTLVLMLRSQLDAVGLNTRCVTGEKRRHKRIEAAKPTSLGMKTPFSILSQIIRAERKKASSTLSAVCVQKDLPQLPWDGIE